MEKGQDLTFFNVTSNDDDEFGQAAPPARLSAIELLERGSKLYSGIHGWVALVMCSFGIVNNFLNVVVLTRKEMRSPTNLILAAIAVADAATMIVYLPYVVYYYHYTVAAPHLDHPKSMVRLALFAACCTITCHTISIWLTVSLATFRAIIVRCAAVLGRNRKWATYAHAKIVIVLVVVAVVVACIPLYLSYEVARQTFGLPENEGEGNVTVWWVRQAQNDLQMHRIDFWIEALAFKTIPCFLLISLSFVLLYSRRQIYKRHMNLLKKKGKTIMTQDSPTGQTGGKSGKSNQSDKWNQHSRTTAMLLAIVLLFWICELPNGIMFIWCAIDPSVFETHYTKFGDLFDGAVLINSSINFVLCCIMSAQYRQTFRSLFCSYLPTMNFPKIIKRKKGSLNHRRPTTHNTCLTEASKFEMEILKEVRGEEIKIKVSEATTSKNEPIYSAPHPTLQTRGATETFETEMTASEARDVTPEREPNSSAL